MLDNFVEWCRIVSENALVTDVVLTKSKDKGFNSFRLLYKIYLE